MELTHTTLNDRQLREAIRNNGGPFSGIMEGGNVGNGLGTVYSYWEAFVSPSGRRARRVCIRSYFGTWGIRGGHRDSVLCTVSKDADGYATAAHALEQYAAGFESTSAA